ncbi:MAG: MFS transporter [Dehalococcoidia bacterium]|nr:MFS transporter [Dehalococcoidia bacterium]MDP7083810.1 MFS transporter [Dehalococcoidia bacterium]HJN87805.1 MFS transporter [Dehalococcoidia bacterium]
MRFCGGTASPAEEKVRRPRSGAFILTNLSIGHGITHWYMASMLLMLPVIQKSLGLSDFQFASLHTIRQVSSGSATIPTGVLIDMAKNQWGLILTGCMIMAGIASGLISLSPSYLYLAVVIVLLPLPGTIWHIPAIAAISQRMPDRRGMGLSIHGIGSQLGTSLGPYGTGHLLALMAGWSAMEAWRSVTLIYVAPAIVMAVVVWWSLRDLGSSGTSPNLQTPLRERIRGVGGLLRNRTMLKLMLVIMLRNMGFNSLTIWVPKYLQDSVEDGGLGMSTVTAGMNVSLLTALGVLSSPFLGALSDRYGRKKVLIPSLSLAAVLALAIGQADDGVWLTLTILATGLFTYSLGQILQASVLDQVGKGTEGATMGLVMGLNNIFSALSPIAAAFVVSAYGLSAVFYYNAGLWAAAVAVLSLISLKPPPLAAGTKPVAAG